MHLITWMASFPGPIFFLVILVLICCLSKGSDILVDEAVSLSRQFRISPLMVGLFVISIGTTLPEAAVSIFAAVNGHPELALGNAVGSIICNTGLIMGLVTLVSPIATNSLSIKRQGWFQFAAGILLVVSCIPFTLDHVFETRVLLPRHMGIVFLMLLLCYLWGAFHWSKNELKAAIANSDTMSENLHGGMMVFKLLLGCGLVVAASHCLIPAVQIAAVRMNLPQAVISATMVAFGTSLPELVTSLKAVKKGHGELALGNVIGANILNVLFVTGMAASLTRDGLAGPEHFSRILFPAMITTLIIFGLGMHLSGSVFKKSFSIMLLGIYAVVLFSSYLGMTA